MIKSKLIKKYKKENRTILSNLSLEKDNVCKYIRENVRNKFLPHSKEKVIEFSLHNNKAGTLIFVPYDNADLRVLYINSNNKKLENEVLYKNISDIGSVVEEMGTRFAYLENKNQITEFLNYWCIDRIYTDNDYEIYLKNNKTRKRNL